MGGEGVGVMVTSVMERDCFMTMQRGTHMRKPTSILMTCYLSRMVPRNVWCFTTPSLRNLNSKSSVS